MNEVETVSQGIEVAPAHNSVERVTISRVDNGYLVENQDKHWQGKRTVHLDLDSALETAKNALS